MKTTQNPGKPPVRVLRQEVTSCESCLVGWQAAHEGLCRHPGNEEWERKVPLSIYRTSFPSWCLLARKDDPKDNTHLRGRILYGMRDNYDWSSFFRPTRRGNPTKPAEGVAHAR